MWARAQMIGGFMKTALVWISEKRGAVPELLAGRVGMDDDDELSRQQGAKDLVRSDEVVVVQQDARRVLGHGAAREGGG